MTKAGEPPILREKKYNILSLYTYICGKSEIPLNWQYWAFLSLISACAGNRIWYVQYEETSRLYPNLYVFLVGPSAACKGAAITQVMRIGHDMRKINKLLVNIYAGSTTAAHFEDFLGKSRFDEATGEYFTPNAVCWLINDELARDIGKGPKADDFIKFMTKNYSGGPEVDSGTRSHGHVRLKDPCITWLVGTTKEWLLESLTGDTIRSGFGSRVCPIFSDYTRERMWRSNIPRDYIVVRNYIVSRLIQIASVPQRNGRIFMTDEADKAANEWYLNRKTAGDEALVPFWRRQKDLVVKLAMLLALTSPSPWVIEKGHMDRAVKMVKWLMLEHRKMLNLASTTKRIAAEADVEFMLRKMGGSAGHTDLYRRVRQKGIDKFAFRKIIDTLVDEGTVHRSRTDTGGKFYRLLTDENDGRIVD